MYGCFTYKYLCTMCVYVLDFPGCWIPGTGVTNGCDPGENFLNKTPMAQALRSKINKWDLMRLLSFCKAKDIVKKTKWQPTEW